MASRDGLGWAERVPCWGRCQGWSWWAVTRCVHLFVIVSIIQSGGTRGIPIHGLQKWMRNEPRWGILPQILLFPECFRSSPCLTRISDHSPPYTAWTQYFKSHQFSAGCRQLAERRLEDVPPGDPAIAPWTALAAAPVPTCPHCPRETECSTWPTDPPTLHLFNAAARWTRVSDSLWWPYELQWAKTGTKRALLSELADTFKVVTCKYYSVYNFWFIETFI